jgi:hypothetical protein
VRIDAVATAGTLQYDTTGTGTWAAVTAGQVVSVADINANRLRFSPATNANGAGYATFTFSVRDASTFDAAPNTITLDVTAVNDAPTVSAPATFTVTEDVAGNLTYTGSPFADVDSGSLTVTLSIADGSVNATTGSGVTVGGTGTARTFTGTAAALNTFFTTAGNITYTGAADNNTARTLTTQVSDGANRTVMFLAQQ